MYKFCCLNPKHQDKLDFYFSEYSDGQCPGCGLPLKLLGETSNVFARIGSMTHEQRQKVLLKRSAEHSRTNADIRERREKLHNDVNLRPPKS